MCKFVPITLASQYRLTGASSGHQQKASRKGSGAPATKTVRTKLGKQQLFPEIAAWMSKSASPAWLLDTLRKPGGLRPPGFSLRLVISNCHFESGTC